MSLLPRNPAVMLDRSVHQGIGYNSLGAQTSFPFDFNPLELS